MQGGLSVNVKTNGQYEGDRLDSPSAVNHGVPHGVSQGKLWEGTD